VQSWRSEQTAVIILLVHSFLGTRMKEESSLTITTVDKYCFRVPLLIHANGVSEVPDNGWNSGERWIETLSSEEIAGTVKALVLPLELKTRSRRYQDLFGIELIDWLRWCAPEPMRWVPVVALGWQQLPAILRRKPNLLLVSSGTQFREIKDAIARDRQRLRDDVAAAQKGELASCNERSLRLFAMGTAVEAAKLHITIWRMTITPRIASGLAISMP